MIGTETAAQTAPALLWPKWVRWGLVPLMVLSWLSIAFIHVENIWLAGEVVQHQAWIGYNPVSTPDTPTGWQKIAQVIPASPAARADIRVGDRIYYHATLEGLRTWSIGHRFTLSVERGGQVSPRSFVVPHPPPGDVGIFNFVVFEAWVGLFAMLMGAVLIWRCWTDRAAVLLGCILLCSPRQSLYLLVWAPDDASALILTALAQVSACAWPALLLFFALFVSNGDDSRRQMRFTSAAAIVIVGMFTAAQVGFYMRARLLLPGSWIDVAYAIALAGSAVFFAIILANLRRHDAAGGNRLKLIMLARLLYLLAAMFFVILNRQDVEWGAGPPWSLLLAVLAGNVVAPGLLAFIVVRHKLFDLDFAVSRTLLYAVVSFILLSAFGLFEWLFERIIPESWHSESALYSAGIAVGVFLAFHRVRDFVEHHMEALFFRRWRENEQVLRQFVREARFILRTDALRVATLAEFKRFSGGAAVALYLEGDGAFTTEGDAAPFPAALDADDPLLVALRARNKPLDPREHARSRLTAALVLPMHDRDRLTGAVVLGTRADGANYRPDEIELLGWAAQQVGLDLHAIAARTLQQKVTELELGNRQLAKLLLQKQTA